MAKKLYKETKKLYSRRYRREHPEKVARYNKEHSDDTVSRIQARREMIKKHGKSKLKGKDIHHKDGNPKNNSKNNLKVVRKHHEGGAGKGNKNAKKKK